MSDPILHTLPSGHDQEIKLSSIDQSTERITTSHIQTTSKVTPMASQASSSLKVVSTTAEGRAGGYEERSQKRNRLQKKKREPNNDDIAVLQKSRSHLHLPLSKVLGQEDSTSDSLQIIKNPKYIQIRDQNSPEMKVTENLSCHSSDSIPQLVIETFPTSSEQQRAALTSKKSNLTQFLLDQQVILDNQKRLQKKHPAFLRKKSKTRNVPKLTFKTQDSSASKKPNVPYFEYLSLYHLDNDKSMRELKTRKKILPQLKRIPSQAPPPLKASAFSTPPVGSERHLGQAKSSEDLLNTADLRTIHLLSRCGQLKPSQPFFEAATRDKLIREFQDWSKPLEHSRSSGKLPAILQIQEAPHQVYAPPVPLKQPDFSKLSSRKYFKLNESRSERNATSSVPVPRTKSTSPRLSKNPQPYQSQIPIKEKKDIKNRAISVQRRLTQAAPPEDHQVLQEVASSSQTSKPISRAEARHGMQWLTKSDIQFFHDKYSQSKKKRVQDKVREVIQQVEREQPEYQETVSRIKKSLISKLGGGLSKQSFKAPRKSSHKQESSFEEGSSTTNQEDSVGDTTFQNLGDIGEVFKNIDQSDLKERQMVSRIASSYFPDKKAIQQGNFNIKEALIQGMAQQQRQRSLSKKLGDYRMSDEQIVGSSDFDVERTVSSMKANKPFQDFFNSYHDNLEGSIEEMQDLAAKKMIGATGFYVCKDKYSDPLRSHLKNKNLYRVKAQDFVQKQIQGNKFKAATEQLTERVRKEVLSEELEIKVRQLRKKQLEAIKEKIASKATVTPGATLAQQVESQGRRQMNLNRFVKANPILTQSKKVSVQFSKLNEMKQRNYGAWYLKPDDFNRRNDELARQFSSLRKAK